jgi:integrase
MKKACASVGVKYGRNLTGGFVTHDARHTAVTRMLQAGIDLSTVGAITGHSDNQLILHYSHATRDSRRKAIEVLENVMNEAESESAQMKLNSEQKMLKAS